MKPAFNFLLANQFVERAKAQQMKGKARDRAALEFFCGATAAMALTSPRMFNRVSLAAMLVSVRGYSEVERMAAK